MQPAVSTGGWGWGGGFAQPVAQPVVQPAVSTGGWGFGGSSGGGFLGGLTLFDDIDDWGIDPVADVWDDTWDDVDFMEDDFGAFEDFDDGGVWIDDFDAFDDGAKWVEDFADFDDFESADPIDDDTDSQASGCSNSPATLE